MLISPTIFPSDIVAGVVLHGPRQCAEVPQFLTTVLPTFAEPSWAIAAVKQVHGSAVLEVPPLPHCAEADALVTAQLEICLTIRVADCAAVLCAEMQRGVVAAIHAGWRGLHQQIVYRTLVLLQRRFAVDPSRCLGYVSPCISAEVYEVGADVAALFPDTAVWQPERQRFVLDIRAEVQRQLQAAGVPATGIEVSPLCTYQTPACASYRRDGEQAERMVAFIGRRP